MLWHYTTYHIYSVYHTYLADSILFYTCCLAFQRTSMIFETSRERKRETKRARENWAKLETCCKLKLAVRSRAFKNTIYTLYIWYIEKGGLVLDLYRPVCIFVIFRFVLFFVFFLRFCFSFFFLLCKQCWGLFLNIYGVASYTIPY